MGGIPWIELKNARFSFHVFQKMLIPYSRCSIIDKTDLKDVSPRVFSKVLVCLGVVISKIIFPKNAYGLSGILLSTSVGAKSGIMVSGVMGISTISKNMDM